MFDPSPLLSAALRSLTSQSNGTQVTAAPLTFRSSAPGPSSPRALSTALAPSEKPERNTSAPPGCAARSSRRYSFKSAVKPRWYAPAASFGEPEQPRKQTVWIWSTWAVRAKALAMLSHRGEVEVDSRPCSCTTIFGVEPRADRLISLSTWNQSLSSAWIRTRLLSYPPSAFQDGSGARSKAPPIVCRCSLRGQGNFGEKGTGEGNVCAAVRVERSVTAAEAAEEAPGVAKYDDVRDALTRRRRPTRIKGVLLFIVADGIYC